MKCEKEVNWAFGSASPTDPGPLSYHCRACPLQLAALNQKTPAPPQNVATFGQSEL